MAKPKFGYPALALLDWLCESGPDRRLFSAGGGMSSRGVYLFEASEPDAAGKRRLTRIWPVSRLQENPEAQALLERLGGRDSIDYHALYQAKFLKGFNKLGHNDFDSSRGRKSYEDFVATLDRDYFHFSDSAIVVTPAGFEFWRSQGRDLAASMRAERQAKRAAVARTILIGHTATIRPRMPKELKIPKDLVLPLPARRIRVPVATATVTRQTATRIYVTDVHQLPVIGDGGWRGRAIEGSFPNQYVAPETVMVDGCTPALADRLVAIATEFQDDADAIGARIVAEILPRLLDLDSRLKQKDAERADAVAEALRAAGHAVPAPGDPDPEPDEPPTP